jgi:hypothetical protein
MFTTTTEETRRFDPEVADLLFVPVDDSDAVFNLESS